MWDIPIIQATQKRQQSLQIIQIFNRRMTLNLETTNLIEKRTNEDFIRNSKQRAWQGGLQEC